jgi:hypothetical protein
MKNVVDAGKTFFVYFNALETHSEWIIYSSFLKTCFLQKGAILHYISDIDSIRSVDIFICKRLRSNAKPAARHPSKAVEGLGTI